MPSKQFILGFLLSIAPLCADSLSIVLAEGQHAVVARSAFSARRFAVRVTDGSGRGVANATVHFRLPEQGPSGAFSSGLKTESLVTDGQGRAGVYGITWNGIPGALILMVSAVSGGRKAEAAIAVEISPAAKAEGGGKRAFAVKKGSGAKKWLILAAVGGGAMAGLAFAGGSSGAAAPAGVVAPIVTPPSIGAPSITVGRPQ
ncbi:MAG: hypothetical protein HY821_22805 [Acidobacteria bacterium]|nr:hypothetical protein [Acidobacteriota bacterium]